MIKEFRSLVNSFKLLIYTIKNRNRFKATVSIIEKRLNICYNCTDYKKDSYLLIFKKPKCGVCGCYIKYKVALDFEECPLKKW